MAEWKGYIMEKFTPEETLKHLDKLAIAFFKNLEVGRSEFGSIGLDAKRPFGNSSVEYDVLKIIEVMLSEELEEYARDLYFNRLIPHIQSIAEKAGY